MADNSELRVILVCNHMSIGGGAEALVLNMFYGLKKRSGVKVKLVTFKKLARPTGYDIAGIEDPLNSDPDFLDSNDYVSLSVTKANKIDVSEFTTLVKSFKPHVIHSHLFASEMIAHEVLFDGVKYISHCHDNMPQMRNLTPKTFTKKHLLTNFYEKQRLVAQYKKCNAKFISISDDTTSYFKSVLPASLKGNIIPMDNAIVTKVFESARHERELESIRIVNVGRFTTTKNQQFLVDIAKVLVDRGRMVEVVMLGKGAEHENVLAKVAAYGLQHIISLPGTQADMATYYGAANLYVHVCRHEPFGLVLLEAMASGLPVVSLDGRGNRSLIEQGQNGYMLTRENANEFADAIEKVLADKAAYKTMSDKAIAFANKYDIEEYLTKLIGIYRDE